MLLMSNKYNWTSWLLFKETIQTPKTLPTTWQPSLPRLKINWRSRVGQLFGSKNKMELALFKPNSLSSATQINDTARALALVAPQNTLQLSLKPKLVCFAKICTILGTNLRLRCRTKCATTLLRKSFLLLLLLHLLHPKTQMAPMTKAQMNWQAMKTWLYQIKGGSLP